MPHPLPEICLNLLVLSSPAIQPIVLYSILYIVSSVSFIFVCRIILRRTLTARTILVLILAGVSLRLALIPISPIGSDDYYRYLWDGKVISNGINPYRYSPNDSSLAGLRSQTLPSRINFPDMKTIYPPLAEILFYTSYAISGESFIGLKILLFIFDMGTILGIFLILKKLNVNRQNILIYVLCPLPLFQFFVDGHMDGFGIPLLVFAILSHLNDRKILSYVLVGLSICVKPLALIVIPILFFAEEDLAERLKALSFPLAVCVFAYVPFVFSGAPFQALGTFAQNWTFNGLVFDVLNFFLHDNQRTRIICAFLLLITYTPVVLSRKDIITKIFLSLILLFLFSPVVHPWYLGWLAFLLPVKSKWSGIAFVSLVSLTSFTLITYQLTGIWKEYPTVIVLEYVPVLVFLVIEMRQIQTAAVGQ